LAYGGPTFPRKLHQAQSHFTDFLKNSLLHKNWYITSYSTAFLIQ